MFSMKQFSMKKFLETNTGKAIYVGCVTVTLSAVGGWAVLAHQDSPSRASTATTTAKSRPAMGDSHFAKEAAQGGMAEVKLGQLAQEKGSSDSVKGFGKRMVDDHSKAGDKLKEVASRENITLPTLQEHLKQAKEMTKTVGGTTAAKGTKTKANSVGR